MIDRARATSALAVTSGDRLLHQDHPVVMGVLNVTPDSFSDGGRYADLDAAVGHGIALHRDGADLVDVGGESTRPGAERVDAATETARVAAGDRGLAAAGVPLSIDTTRAAVAAAALAAGAVVVNDVSGGLADPDMAAVVADAGCPWVLMHWRGTRGGMQRAGHLPRRGGRGARRAARPGRRRDRRRRRPGRASILDPGLGFAKNAEHNWALSAHLDELIALGYPVLFGASRKSYLGRLLAGPDGTPRPVDEREAATIATSVLAVAAGAWGVRVHDVRGDRSTRWPCGAATGSPRLASTVRERAR